jgi:hypothetical protein
MNHLIFLSLNNNKNKNERGMSYMSKLKRNAKRTVLFYCILSVFIISMFLIETNYDLKRKENNSTPLYLISNDSINVTRPTIGFDNESMVLNVSNVYANINGVYFNGSSGNRPEISTFSILKDMDDSSTGITESLNDTNIDGSWNATIDLDSYSISPGIYYLTCYFENDSGLINGKSPESERFAILGKYNITTAQLSYDQNTQRLNITEITIRNETSVLNNSGVTFSKWSIFYNDTGSNTSYTGNLNYDSNTKKWNATGIDVSNLPVGTYFVISFFTINNSDSVSNISREILQTFTVVHHITITNLYLNYTNELVQEISIGAAANTSFNGGSAGRYLSPEEAIAKYIVIFNNNQSSTNINGTLTANENTWNETIDVSTLPEGSYNVTINISHSSDNYTDMKIQNTSSFTIIHSIGINIPKPVFNRGLATLDILQITAQCSYSKLGYLSDSEVDLHYFKIFNSSNDFINIGNNLTYNGGSGFWEYTGISLENITEGFYYILVFFNNTIVPEGKQTNSTNFEVIHKINFQIFNTHYIAGFDQILNITGVSASSSYFPYSQLEGYNAFNTHNYSFYDKNSRLPADPPLTGMLTWNGSFWNAINVDVSNLPVGEYYVVLNFADNYSINSFGNPSQNNFTVEHVINVSIPLVNYTNEFSQVLNITNITAQTSYYPFSNLNESTAEIYTYHIFNDTFEFLSGQLVWNDPNWEAINIDVSSLDPGSYQVKCIFSSEQTGSIISENSSIFQVSHVINISKPVISYDSDANSLDISNVQVYSSNKEYVSDSTAIIYKYQIFTENNASTGLIGNLTWNKDKHNWEAIDIDVSSLSQGEYYVKINFSAFQIAGIYVSNSSDLFEVPAPPAEPPNYFWVFVIVILAIILPFAIAFIRKLIIRKKEEEE